MSRKFVFGGSYTSFVFEPETIAYMNAIGIADDSTVYYGGTVQEITGNGLWIAVNNFFLEAKPNSWYTKCNSAHPYIGGTADRHKFNAKNPLDTDAAFRETFIGGWNHNELGVTGNGINTYTNTHYNARTNHNLGGTVSIYNRTNNAGTYYDLATGSTTDLLILKWSDNNIYTHVGVSGVGYGMIPNPDPTGLWAMNWDTTRIRVYRNGTLFQDRARDSYSDMASNNWSLGSHGSSINSSNRNYCFRAMFTSELTPTEQSDFRTAVQNLQIALNRHV